MTLSFSASSPVHHRRYVFHAIQRLSAVLQGFFHVEKVPVIPEASCHLLSTASAAPFQQQRLFNEKAADTHHIRGFCIFKILLLDVELDLETLDHVLSHGIEVIAWFPVPFFPCTAVIQLVWP